MTAMAPTIALRIKKARRSVPDGASCVTRPSREELSGSFPLASESGLSDLFDMLDTFLEAPKTYLRLGFCNCLIRLTESINSRQLGKTLGRRINAQTHEQPDQIQSGAVAP
jgi:hypothetical protein